MFASQATAYAIHMELDLDVVEDSNNPLVTKSDKEHIIDVSGRTMHQVEGSKQAEIVLSGVNDLFTTAWTIKCNLGSQPNCGGGMLPGYCSSLCSCNRNGELVCPATAKCTVDQIIAGCVGEDSVGQCRCE